MLVNTAGGRPLHSVLSFAGHVDGPGLFAYLITILSVLQSFPILPSSLFLFGSDQKLVKTDSGPFFHLCIICRSYGWPWPACLPDHHPVSAPILSYPILSYPILSYPILSYPILSYPIILFVSLWFWSKVGEDRWRALLSPLLFAGHVDGPGLFAYLITILSVLLIILTLPVSLIFAVKVVQVQLSIMYSKLKGQCQKMDIFLKA